jgi:hypothetical protein
MCLHTSTQLYYRSRESRNEIARMILAISQMISTFNSDFFIRRFLFKSEPAQTLLSEVFYSRPIKALSQRVDQTFGNQTNNFGPGRFYSSVPNYLPFSRCLPHRHKARSCLTPRIFTSPRLSGMNFLKEQF